MDRCPRTARTPPAALLGVATFEVWWTPTANLNIIPATYGTSEKRLSGLGQVFTPHPDPFCVFAHLRFAPARRLAFSRL